MSFLAVNQACRLCHQPLYNEKLAGDPDSREFAKRHVHQICEKVLRAAIATCLGAAIVHETGKRVMFVMACGATLAMALAVLAADKKNRA